MDLTIQLAREQDLDAINAIYNHFVAVSTCTYQESPASLAERQAWFREHQGKHPATVALLDGRIVGWGSLSPISVRCGWRFTVEDSVYIHHEFHRKGIGRAILADLLARAKELGMRNVIGIISGDQAASIALHKALGFAEVGRLKTAGKKFGCWLDVVYMQREIDGFVAD